VWVSNGVEIHKKKRDTKSKGEKEFTLLHVGRLSVEKKVDVLLQALKRYEVKTYILSDGPVRPSLETLARQLGLRKVAFKGYVGNVSDWYAKADAIVIPSTSEIQSIVQLESLAFGKPIIAADSASNKELIVDGVNGLLFEKDNPKDFAEKIEKMADEKLRRKFSKNSLKLAKEHSIEKTAEKLAAIYAEFVK
jgi:glycosyltransferase involved in cell wall biosynthesis